MIIKILLILFLLIGTLIYIFLLFQNEPQSFVAVTTEALENTYISDSKNVISNSIRIENVTYNLEKNSTCIIEPWNMVHTIEVKLEEQHRKWIHAIAITNVTLADSQLRVISAFVYQEEIVVTTSAQNRFSKTVHCRYFDCNRREIRDSTWQTFMFPSSAAFCVRRAGVAYMSLSDDPNSIIENDNMVQITKRIDPTPKHEISVCVGPMYGNETRWLEILETTEHHLLMGIQHFYFTIFNEISSISRKLLDHYERLGYGETTVIQTEYRRMTWMQHMIQQNDCFFRSRHHSKWVLNVDIDERLVMTGETLMSLLGKIPSNVIELIVSSNRVQRTHRLPEKYVDEKHLDAELEYHRYNITTNRFWEASKTIIRPTGSASMFYHWVVGRYNQGRTMSIPKTIAHIRHYRTTGQGLKQNWIYDYVPYHMSKMNEKFVHVLDAAIHSRVKWVFEQRLLRCSEIPQNLLRSHTKDNYDCIMEDGKYFKDHL